jgi:hypothetical protein
MMIEEVKVNTSRLTFILYQIICGNVYRQWNMQAIGNNKYISCKQMARKPWSKKEIGWNIGFWQMMESILASPKSIPPWHADDQWPVIEDKQWKTGDGIWWNTMEDDRQIESRGRWSKLVVNMGYWLCPNA